MSGTNGASGVTDFDSLRRAMAENSEQPEGPARNARAELLLAEAEKLGIPLAVIEALGHQLKVYNYSSEKAKMFVPFARLLRLWDETPGDFDEYETHSLYWVFKWMTSGMLDQPHVPLASVEKWLSEMDRRYRLAGHSERAVRSSEFSVAAHIGDRERAARAYTAWLAADRDRMADCHACELNSQGWWQARLGDDEAAVVLWRPVLEGEFTCAHEPHTTLASSLAPLLRLGRTDEARANHLRGFRLVRPMESMRDAYADHVEFCALTGNEARGLELLTQRPSYFTDMGHPQSALQFQSVVALLMDRLVSLGRGGLTVPGPAGRTWTAAELAEHARAEALALAARFDERNGTTAVGDRARERMAQAPLVDRLPLGVRAPRSAAAPAAPAPAPAARATGPGPGLAELLAEARRLSDTLRPNAVAAWAAAARAAEEAEAQGVTDGLPTALDRAEIADHAAMGAEPGAAVALFERAAELYARAGDPGEALAARARAAFAHALDGRTDEALAAVADPYERVLALYAEGGTGVRQTVSVVMARARILMRPVHEGDEPAPEDLAAAEQAAREVLALAGEPSPDDVRLGARVAEAHGMLAETAAGAGDARGAAELFARAAEEYVRLGLPWYAVELEARLAQLAQHLGDLAEAERALRAALEHGGEHVTAAGRARLHLHLSDLLGGADDPREAADQALEAAHWADEADESRTLGAWARHRLGGHLLRQGRWAEAAEVLESALTDLAPGTHGDGPVVQTRWWLGDCLSELGEHRDAAEHRLRAADIARHWPEQDDHAMLAHLAAESLGQAGLPAEADRAYDRAAGLWHTLGNSSGLVRALRARAWLALRTGAGREGARELMAQAARECADAADAAPDAAGRDRALADLAHTHRQFGDLLARSADADAGDDALHAALTEALAEVEASIALFDTLGPDEVHSRTGAELAAGWLESDLGRPDAATARARGVLARYEGLPPSEASTARRTEAENLLAQLAEQAAAQANTRVP
ncbi:tetratricopeptide repeat protein [Streptomyces sp. NPDC008150]|uniref:tetratricopeptide repeat protein n=1 Tax=Streptomyces sp. NPDC008150 TaxID=3364816 RepID=UPI0036EB4023